MRSRRPLDIGGFVTLALLALPGACGKDDEPRPPRPRGGIIEPALGSPGGGAGAAGQPAQANSAGASGAAGAPHDPLGIGQNIGQPCESSADCPSELDCLPALTDDTASAPPAGLCTLACDTSNVCNDYGTRCINVAGGHYCVQACSYGPGDKCHSRQDFACEPTYRRVEVACDIDSDCAQSAVCRNGACYLVTPLCLPRCNGPNDCPGGHCHPVSGECVSQPPEGEPLGTACDPDASSDPCRGLCLKSPGDTTARCTEFCTLGNDLACGPDAACLLTLGTAGGSSPGDQGACAPLCGCNSDCPEGLSCLALGPTPSERGYCAAAGSAAPSIECDDGGSAGAGGAG